MVSPAVTPVTTTVGVGSLPVAGDVVSPSTEAIAGAPGAVRSTVNVKVVVVVKGSELSPTGGGANALRTETVAVYGLPPSLSAVPSVNTIVSLLLVSSSSASTKLTVPASGMPLRSAS